MELSWSTFLLEIVNFLVLVWILKRFFYKPLQSVIARRQQDIEQRLATARKMQEDAQHLQQQYENRLDSWERERQQAREALQREIKTERTRLEGELRESLQQQRQKSEVVEQRRQQELRHKIEQQALEQGSHFATRLLEQSAGPELEEQLQELLVSSLEEMPDEQLQELRRQLAETDELVEVASAFPLSVDRREQVKHALRKLLQKSVQCHFVEDPELLAGLSITIGPWMLAANVRDELRGFAEIAREGTGE